MKKTKFISLSLSAFILICALSACGAKSMDPVSMTDGKNIISLESTQDQVEAIFGQGSEDRGRMKYIYEGTDFEITYDNDGKIKFMYVQLAEGSETSLWKDSMGIGVGSAEDELVAAYDLTGAEKKGFIYNVFFVKKGGRIVRSDNVSEPWEYDLAYAMDQETNSVIDHIVMLSSRTL